MSDSTVRLLRAAAEILGGEAKLARHLDITDLLLRAYLESRRPLPDYLLLRAVDVVLDNISKPQAKRLVEDAVRELKNSGRRP